jgi:hypothetical protein
LDSWRATRDTLAGYSKVIGKIRRALTPPQKHWWHASLHVTAVGLTTTPVWTPDGMFEVVLDLAGHHARITTSDGQQRAVPMAGQSSADFCGQLQGALADLGLSCDFDRSVCAETAAGAYDPAAVARYWQALSRVDAILKRFRHGFRAESSPVQLWPHHFDLAVLWLSGRLVPGQDPDDPDYADEQMNFGFSTGDEGIPEPYFYATAYPTPAGFTEQALPDGATWYAAGWTGAVLAYAFVTRAGDPQARLLEFLAAAHEAGARFMRQV